MDRNGTLARIASPVINWASDTSNRPMRALMENVDGIDRNAELPKLHTRTFVSADKGDPIAPTRRRRHSESARRPSMPPVL